MFRFHQSLVASALLLSRIVLVSCSAVPISLACNARANYRQQRVLRPIEVLL